MPWLAATFLLLENVSERHRVGLRYDRKLFAFQGKKNIPDISPCSSRTKHPIPLSILHIQPFAHHSFGGLVQFQLGSFDGLTNIY